MKRNRGNQTILVFLLLSVAGYFISGLDFRFVASEVTTRILRNSIMVLSLIIPIVAGLGLNFAISIGALCAQAALLFALNYGLTGYGGLLFVTAVSTVLSIGTGAAVGMVLNHVKGREMIATIIIGYIGISIYQLIFMVGFGTVIPVANPDMLLSRGIGVRHMVDLEALSGIIDHTFEIHPFGIPVSLLTVLLIVGFSLLIQLILKSRLGLNFRAVGENMEKAAALGIDVNRIRMTAIIISTVLASYGQILYLQNIGMLSVYTAQSNREIFSSAAILAGGAGIKNAGIRNVFLGLFLFHLLFVVSPQAGQNLFSNVAIGEYFRTFVSYAVICFAIVMNGVSQDSKRHPPLRGFSTVRMRR